MKTSAVGRLVQVGVRDLCEEEINVMNRGMGRVKTFFDEDLKASLGAGKSWEAIAGGIV